MQCGCCGARVSIPFERSNMLELVVNDGDKRADAQRLPATVRQPQVPAQAAQTAPAAAPAPSLDDAARAQEILRMQRDIANRRRKRLLLLAARLMVFIMLPTLLVGYYYYNVATPVLRHDNRIPDPEIGIDQPGGRAWRPLRRHQLCDLAGIHRGAELPRKPRGDADARRGIRPAGTFLGPRDRPAEPVGPGCLDRGSL